jgi:hypothetical protein
MAGGVFSEAQLFGMTIRESANDGSDFTNPAADYRRLFLGEDGLLHLRDSAGTVTTLGSGSVAADTIWDAAGDLAVGSGADTAARLAKGNAGGALSIINAAVAWNSGTSFPASKLTGDRFWRTDLNLEATWDGTRWVTTTLFRHEASREGANPFTANSIVVRGIIGYGGTFDTYIHTIHISSFVLTTNTGANYWNFAASRAPSATSLGTADTSADTPSTWTNHTLTVNAVSGTTDREWEIDATKTGAPGNLYIAVAMAYRLILT